MSAWPLVCPPSAATKKEHIKRTVTAPAYVVLLGGVLMLTAPDLVPSWWPALLAIVIVAAIGLGVILIPQAFSRLEFTPEKVVWVRPGFRDAWVDLTSLASQSSRGRGGKPSALWLTDSSNRKLTIPLAYGWAHQEIWGPLLVASLTNSGLDCPPALEAALLGERSLP